MRSVLWILSTLLVFSSTSAGQTLSRHDPSLFPKLTNKLSVLVCKALDDRVDVGSFSKEGVFRSYREQIAKLKKAARKASGKSASRLKEKIARLRSKQRLETKNCRRGKDERLGLLAGEPRCAAADLNRDTIVDFVDLRLFIRLYKKQRPQADLSMDGKFDRADLNLFLACWGKIGSPLPPSPTVPGSSVSSSPGSNGSSSSSSAFSSSLPSSGSVFYVDPVSGSMSNDGSFSRPWRTLQEVFEGGLIETRYAVQMPWISEPENAFEPVGGFRVRNPGAPVKAGDTILLRTGYHGEVWYRGAFNTDYITIAAQNGERPALRRILLSAASKWIIRGVIVSPEAAPEYTNPGILAEFEWHGWWGPSWDNIFTDNTLYSVQDSSGWSADDWNNLSASGIRVHSADTLIARNSLKNVNFGIVAGKDRIRVEENIIENIAGDGMVGSANGLQIVGNRFKNFYRVNSNHDDALQFHRGADGSTPIEDAYVARNIFIDYESEYPLRGSPQGLCSFGNPLNNFRVENNLVLTNHWHGISLYNIRNSVIINNIATNPSGTMTAWITLGPTGSQNTVVRNNMSRSFMLQGVDIIADHNIDLDEYDPALLFLDFANYDLRHRPGSPAINQGSSVDAPHDDIERRQRDAQPDIGPYEYVGY